MKQNNTEVIRWLHYATEDIESARSLLNLQISFRNVSYLSQQCIEKAIKACYISRNQNFDKSHNLEYLRRMLEGNWLWKENAPDLTLLTEFAIEARYPGDWEEVAEEEAVEALQTAELVLRMIENELRELQ
jgi:HEPN domain-containing protein